MVLVVLSSILNIGCGVMRVLFNDSHSSNQTLTGGYSGLNLEQYINLNPLVYAVMGILLVLLVKIGSLISLIILS